VSPTGHANKHFSRRYQDIFKAVSVIVILGLHFSPIAPALATVYPPTVTSPNVFTSGPATPKVNGTSGALTETIPLDIPPGRNGLQPDLSLNYNSQNTDQDSLVGYGWSLSIPYIERLNKTESENKYANAQYFTSSVDGELATTTSNYTFRARVDDNGSFDLYSFATSTNTWTVYDKNGTEYLYGASDQSRLESTSTPIQIYKWMLEKEIDTNGNYVRYLYNKDENQVYPYEILYTGTGVTDGPMKITFATSTRTDSVESYKTDFFVETNYRISQINTYVSGTLARQYNLSYTTGNNGFRSLLPRSKKTDGMTAVSRRQNLPRRLGTSARQHYLCNKQKEGVSRVIHTSPRT
jgi:hypothetical protein